jgi:hypothetical protein
LFFAINELGTGSWTSKCIEKNAVPEAVMAAAAAVVVVGVVVTMTKMVS